MRHDGSDRQPRQRARVKRACKLRDRRAARGRGALSAEGLRLCTDLAQRLPPEEVYCTQKLLDAHPELAALGGRHFLVSDAVAAKLSDTKGPQGLFCVSPPDKKRWRRCAAAGAMCLEHIQDPPTWGAAAARRRSASRARCCAAIAPTHSPQGGAGLHGHAGQGRHHFCR